LRKAFELPGEKAAAWAAFPVCTRAGKVAAREELVFGAEICVIMNVESMKLLAFGCEFHTMHEPSLCDEAAVATVIPKRCL
jgi:hypothetical protein